jgi:ribonuclease HII
MGPKFALQFSYSRAIEELVVKPDILLVDGKPGLNKVRSWKGKQHVIVKGDLAHKEISIASIIAKVIRDTVMNERAKWLEETIGANYNWAVNKGYGTPDHYQAIEKYGLMFGPGEFYQHRRSYCSKLLGKTKLYGTGS